MTRADASAGASSIVITTYGGECGHTQACLGAIRRWKAAHHEVVVVVHDETPMLGQFLRFCETLGIADTIVYAESGHGHVRGVNLGFEHATSDIVFNLCIDMRIGSSVVDSLAARLIDHDHVGLVGWHYDWDAATDGSIWERDAHGDPVALNVTPRIPNPGDDPGRLSPEQEAAIRGAAWSTGRTLAATGTARFTCANGSFFGLRRQLWNALGGFDERSFPVHFADDALTYAVLDQGLDVENLPADWRCGRSPQHFLALTDRKWQKRADPERGRDEIVWTIEDRIDGLTERENVFLELLSRTEIDDGIEIVGDAPWPRPGSPLRAIGPDGSARLVVVGPEQPRQATDDAASRGATVVRFRSTPDAGAYFPSFELIEPPRARERFVRD